jgi:cytoskeletal protein CcmA (bactofilin family)
MRALIRKLIRRRRRILDRIRFTVVIGPEMFFRGTLRGDDHTLVCGQVEGDADLDGTLVLSEGGYWEGDITAANVVLAGEVHGNVSARAKLEIAPSARIYGNLRSPVIAMAEGAVHEADSRIARRTRMIRFNERRSRNEKNRQD